LLLTTRCASNAGENGPVAARCPDWLRGGEADDAEEERPATGRLQRRGIDGQIEFVDAQEQVKGFAVAAQVKGTLVGFAGENRDACRFTCEADKIDYWLAYGRPVVLICVNLRSQEAWWKRVDTWFADPVRRARRVVEFDKAADRFDPDGFSSLSALGVPAGQPLPRLDGSERLVSNLLAVTGFAPVIRSASTPCRTRADAWERMGSNGAFESGFILSAGQIYTMCQLEDGPLAVTAMSVGSGLLIVKLSNAVPQTPPLAYSFTDQNEFVAAPELVISTTVPL